MNTHKIKIHVFSALAHSHFKIIFLNSTNSSLSPQHSYITKKILVNGRTYCVFS